MKLYFGGAYNGKLDLVKEKYNICDSEVFYCNNSNIDFSKKVIYNLQKFIESKILEEESSLEFIKENIDKLRDKIIISNDITKGIVPIKKEDRLLRDEVGKVLQYLSKESEAVYRVFFGIENKIKGE